MKLYHFTSTWHLPRIEADGVLRTTESNGDIRPGRDHAKPDVVWLLDTDDLAGLPHGLAGSAVDKTRVRITIDLPDYRVERWTDWATRHGVDDLTKVILIESGGGWEAAQHWYVSEAPIRRRFWVDVTVLPEPAKPLDSGDAPE